MYFRYLVQALIMMPDSLLQAYLSSEEISAAFWQYEQ